MVRLLARLLRRRYRAGHVWIRPGTPISDRPRPTPPTPDDELRERLRGW